MWAKTASRSVPGTPYLYCTTKRLVWSAILPQNIPYLDQQDPHDSGHPLNDAEDSGWLSQNHQLRASLSKHRSDFQKKIGTRVNKNKP